MTHELDILYEDNHLLVINKGANLATMGAAPGAESLVALAKSFLKQKYQKPGNVYLGVVSRLDRMSTGVIVLARTSKAAARLSQQFRERSVSKTYWVLIPRPIHPEAGTLSDYLRKDESRQRMETCSEQHAEAQFARLTYRMLGSNPQATWLEIELETGRKHQIRVQLASRGYPILGDRKYDSQRSFKDGIALHSRRLILTHPTTKQQLQFEAPRPTSWDGIAPRAT